MHASEENRRKLKKKGETSLVPPSLGRRMGEKQHNFRSGRQRAWRGSRLDVVI